MRLFALQQYANADEVALMFLKVWMEAESGFLSQTKIGRIRLLSPIDRKDAFQEMCQPILSDL